MHNCIKKNGSVAINWAKQYVNELNSKDGRRQHNAAVDLPSIKHIMDHVKFIVDNTFFYSGGTVRQQETGLPMGTNTQIISDL